MRRDFIANAAHELRTPLTNLQGYLEALRDGVITADRATYESLWDEAERLVRLSRSLDALAEGDAATTPPRSSSSTSRRRSAPPLDLAQPTLERAGLRLVRRRAGASAGAGQPRPARPGARQPPVQRRRATRRPAAPSRSAPSAGRRTSWSRSPTPARASRRRTSTASSSASTGSRSRATGPAAGPASAWPSSSSWSRPAAAASAPSRRDGHDAVLVQPAGLSVSAVRGWRWRPSRSGCPPARATGSVAAARRGTRPRRGSSPPDRTTPPARPSRSAPISSPVAKATSPRTSSMPAIDDAPTTTRLAGHDGPPAGRSIIRLPATGQRRRGPRSRSTALTPRAIEYDLQPGHRLEGDVGGDRHQREEHERDDREDDARAGEPGRPQPAVEGEPGQEHADRRDRRAEGLERRQRSRRGRRPTGRPSGRRTPRPCR